MINEATRRPRVWNAFGIMKQPDPTQMHEPTTKEEKRSRDAALDETLEGTMDASDAPSTIPNPDRDAAEHDRAEDDTRGPERPQPAH